jgi:hypothetical protein
MSGCEPARCFASPSSSSPHWLFARAFISDTIISSSFFQQSRCLQGLE